MFPTLFPPHWAVIASVPPAGFIDPAKPNCLQRSERKNSLYSMWSQVFVVQPLDCMEFASGLISCALPLAWAG